MRREIDQDTVGKYCVTNVYEHVLYTFVYITLQAPKRHHLPRVWKVGACRWFRSILFSRHRQHAVQWQKDGGSVQTRISRTSSILAIMLLNIICR